MNIQEFIKAKEKEFDELKKSFSAVKEDEWWASDEDHIKHFLSHSLLEYNEKIKEMVRNKKATCLGNPEWMLSIEDRIKNETLDDIITNLTTKGNEKIT